MKNLLIFPTLLMFAGITNAAPVVYTDEALYLADLATLGYAGLHESFEDDATWSTSRWSVSDPKGTTSVNSRGIIWTSNYPQNNFGTSTVGGTAPHGSHAIYSTPHGITTQGTGCDIAQDPNIPPRCYQNDGLKIESESGTPLYAFGGQILINNTVNGAVSFLLDGVDVFGTTADPDNLLRRGGLINNAGDIWDFFGVIDTAGFTTAELREITGKNSEPSELVLLFSDDYTIGVSSVPVPAAVWLFCSGLLGIIGMAGRKKLQNSVMPATVVGGYRYDQDTSS